MASGRPLLAALGGAALLALAAAAVAGPAAAVECGTTITEDTVLTDDLSCSGGPIALTVEGPATLDLNGYILSGNSFVCVRLEGTGARLVDGTVTGCDRGVQPGGGGGHTVRDVTLTGNTVGIEVLSPGNRIQQNTLESDGNNILLTAPDEGFRLA